MLVELGALLVIRLRTLLQAIVFTALVVPSAQAGDIVVPTSIWIDATAERPIPYSAWLELMDKSRCSGPNCEKIHWAHYLERLGVGVLEAPQGGRAYRWMWLGTGDSQGVIGMEIPREGFVEVIFDAKGKVQLRSSWSRRVKTLDASRFVAFETVLAKTDFATLRSSDPMDCMDECQDQILEAVVDGKYHYMARNGGIRESDIYWAAHMLEDIARKYADRK
jgi:hypothetical protein